jgi:hypothetical protein
MLYRTVGWLTLSVLFLNLSVTLSTAVSKTQPITSIEAKKKPARIEGFRSAKFGMRENHIFRAIKKDFEISKTEVKRTGSSPEKTTSLWIDVPDLFGVKGPARIFYIFGYKAQKLMQVNIGWGKGVTKKVDRQSLVDVANLLHAHLMKKEYAEEAFLSNERLNDVTTIIFRGKDKKNRMALLVLNSPMKGNGKDAKATPENISLKLTYTLNPDKLDIFAIGDNDF